MEEQDKTMMDDEEEIAADHIVQQRKLVPRVQWLMPRERRPYGFPVSRDWADIDC